MSIRVAFILKNLHLYTEPLGIMYLSSTLKEAGHETAIFNADKGSGFISRLKEYDPHLIGISTTSGVHRSCLDIARTIKKEMNAPIAFGGPHPTFFPEIIEEKGVDIVCQGEGEEAILELSDRIEEGGDIKGIENLWVKENDTIYRNSLRPFRENLDAIPFPDRKLLRQVWQLAWLGQRFAITGRGCPFNCTYCYNHIAKRMASGRYVRKRSIENLMEELTSAKSLGGVRMFSFLDDTFILHKEWIREFTGRYKKEIGLPFTCWVRANLVDEEICSLLQKGGCIMVAIGVESGNDRIRNDILKRNMSKEQILHACKALRKHEIRFVTQNMMGLPGEDIDSVFETIELNLACRPDYSGFSFFQPFPGTELTQYAIEHGLYDGDTNRISINYSSSPFKFPQKRVFEELYDLYPLLLAYPRLFRLAKDWMIDPEKKRFLKRAGITGLKGLKILNRVVRAPWILLLLLYVTVTRKKDRFYYYIRYLHNLFFIVQILTFKEGLHSGHERD